MNRAILPPDNLPEEPVGQLRRAMTPLHTWAGLVAGWILFVIFCTGTLAVFDKPITRWMQPGMPAPVAAGGGDWDRAGLALKAQRYLEQTAPDSPVWGIGLPSAINPFLNVFWADARQEHFHNARLDPGSGEALPPSAERQTEGGHHFVHVHFELHAGDAGIWLVGFVTIAMLVALVSGVIIHKRIFKDFFTFRPGKGQRSWLDAHNALAVLSLPFQFMIAYTGLAIFYAMYMPAGIAAHFPNENAFFEELLEQPPHREETHIATPVTGLDHLLQRAEETLGRRVGFIRVEHPGDSSAVALVVGRAGPNASGNSLRSASNGRVLFDAVAGQVLDVQRPGEWRGGGAVATQEVMSTLHFAGFGGNTVRWLYFLLGLAGTAMMATGVILFTVKRRQKSLGEFGAQTARVYRSIEVINIATVAGLMTACIAYLWLNRLLPLELTQRAEWEIRGFFAIWALTLVHAATRPQARAWVEQLGIFAALCLALPLLNWLTTGEFFLRYWQNQDGQRLAVELTAQALGLLAIAGAWRIRVAERRRSQRGANIKVRVAKPEVVG